MRVLSIRPIIVAAVAAITLVPAIASADTATVVNNAVIIDNAPFYSIGGEDGIGGGNYGLNFPAFIDIPYATFSFGANTSVSNATLTWNFGTLFNSGPSQITLYVGSDADGAVTTSDRFMGTAINTATYSGGESVSFDVTSFVNAALASNQFFAARFEVDAAPGTLTGYSGGQFGDPSVRFNDPRNGGVPEPASWALMIGGFGLAGTALRRRRAAIVA